MAKSKLALFLDSFLISNLFGLVSYLWLRRIIKNANWVNFLSISIILLCFILIFYLMLKFNKQKIFKNNNEKFIKNCINYLILSDKNTYSRFICELFSCTEIDQNFFKLDNYFLYMNIKTTLTANDYFEAQELFLKYKNENSKLYFIYKNKDKDFDEIYSISNLDISILTFDIISQAMIKKDIYPIEKDNSKVIKKSLKHILKSKTELITKSHFKHIFVTSLSLLFLSFVVPFSNYYLVIGTILLLISIISLFRKDIINNSSDSDFLLK